VSHENLIRGEMEK